MTEKATFALWGAKPQVSLEGIFDNLKDLFKSSVKGEHAGGARDPHRDGLGWGSFRQDIMSTYGSLAWVQKHLHAKQTVPADLAYDLSYCGVQFSSPVYALQHAEKKVYEFHREHEAALLAYLKAVNSITSKKEEDFQKLKKPFPIGFKGPEFFGGKIPVVQSDYVVDEEIPLTGVQINAFSKMPPQLSAKDVVQGAQAIVALVPRLEQHLKDFYKKSGWQDAPVDAAQDTMVEEYTSLTLALCTDIGKWFYLITK